MWTNHTFICKFQTLADNLKQYVILETDWLQRGATRTGGSENPSTYMTPKKELYSLVTCHANRNTVSQMHYMYGYIYYTVCQFQVLYVRKWLRRVILLHVLAEMIEYITADRKQLNTAIAINTLTVEIHVLYAGV